MAHESTTSTIITATAACPRSRNSRGQRTARTKQRVLAELKRRDAARSPRDPDATRSRPTTSGRRSKPFNRGSKNQGTSPQKIFPSPILSAAREGSRRD